MAFIDFINAYVDDEKFKSTVNKLHDLWMSNEGQSKFESAIQPQQTVSTANTPQQNQQIANAHQKQQQQQNQNQNQTKVEPRTVQGDLNNMNSQELMSLAARYNEIEKQKAENQKKAEEAQSKVDNELDQLQNMTNAALNGKTENIV